MFHKELANPIQSRPALFRTAAAQITLDRASCNSAEAVSNIVSTHRQDLRALTQRSLRHGSILPNMDESRCARPTAVAIGANEYNKGNQ